MALTTTLNYSDPYARERLFVGGPLDGELRAVASARVVVPILLPRHAYAAPDQQRILQVDYVPFRLKMPAQMAYEIGIPAGMTTPAYASGLIFRFMALESLTKPPDPEEYDDLYDPEPPVVEMVLAKIAAAQGWRGGTRELRARLGL